MTHKSAHAYKTLSAAVLQKSKLSVIRRKQSQLKKVGGKVDELQRNMGYAKGKKLQQQKVLVIKKKPQENIDAKNAKIRRKSNTTGSKAVQKLEKALN